MTLVLVVDDVRALAEQYAYDLKRLGGYETLVAGGGDAALETIAREAVDCMLLDLEMPGTDGFDVLRALGERNVEVPVIVYTGTGDFDRCVQAMRLGAHGFIAKDESMERVVREVESVLERCRLSGEVARLRERLGEDSSLVGESAPMRALKEMIAKLAPLPSAALIVGESGTGKELVARDLHRLSGRGDEPFIAVNAAALPEHLVESELFGHERGAFTGASQLHRGAFEAAGKGTLFLDEIGELAPGLQAKLLRVLEQREVMRVGGTRVVPIGARVVAATNRNPDDEVAAGRFREDLYYRLNVHVLRVPPLRDRLSDLPALAERLLTRMCRELGMRKKRIAPEALERLMACDWRRNNVRELRNVLERMVIAADADVLALDTLPADIAEGGAPSAEHRPQSYQELKAESERRIVVEALERHDWHITRTAEALGLADHASLLKIMRRLQVARPD
jgi:two-component system nitrogen regulation response regulator NtrX